MSLQRGLRGRRHTVLLMRDETIITETPPRTACSGHRGAQVEVPVTGNHPRRVRHGVRHIRSGAVLFLMTEVWEQQTHQVFLEMRRLHWSGWHLILCEDRGSPHTAATSRQRANALGIAVRSLPRATPELHAMDHLSRYVQGRLLANRATQSIDASADAACQALLAMRRHEQAAQSWSTLGSLLVAPMHVLSRSTLAVVREHAHCVSPPRLFTL